MMYRTILFLFFAFFLSDIALAENFLKPVDVHIGQNINPDDPMPEEALPNCFDTIKHTPISDKKAMSLRHLAKNAHGIAESYRDYFNLMGMPLDVAARYLSFQGKNYYDFEKRVQINENSVTWILSAILIFPEQTLNESDSEFSVTDTFKPFVTPTENKPKHWYETKNVFENRQRETKLKDKENWNKFISRCGTHYVKSIQRGAVVSVSYTFSRLRQNDRLNIKQALSGQILSDHTDVELDQRFRLAMDQIASESQIKWNLYTVGVNKDTLAKRIASTPYDIVKVRQIINDAVNAISPDTAPVIKFGVAPSWALFPHVDKESYDHIGERKRYLQRLFLRQLAVCDQLRRLDDILSWRQAYNLKEKELSEINQEINHLRMSISNLEEIRHNCRSAEDSLDSVCVEPDMMKPISKIKLPEVKQIFAKAIINRESENTFHYDFNTTEPVQPILCQIHFLDDGKTIFKKLLFKNALKAQSEWNGHIDTPGYVPPKSKTELEREIGLCNNESCSTDQCINNCRTAMKKDYNRRNRQNLIYKTIANVASAKLILIDKAGISYEKEIEINTK